MLSEFINEISSNNIKIQMNIDKYTNTKDFIF